MTTPFDVKPDALIGIVSQELKKYPEIKPPEWAAYAKTGVHRDRVPDSPDWWYVRSAAILRTIYISGPVGIERLRTKYGGKKSKGNRPPKFAKGSGNVQRTICQQLEKARLVESTERDGRQISPKGKSMLDKCAGEAATG